MLHTTYSTEGGSSAASWQQIESAASSTTPLAQSGSWGSTGPFASGRPPSSPVKGARGAKGPGVPDFKAMHEKWEAHQAAKKAANAKRCTVPEVRGVMHGLRDQP